MVDLCAIAVIPRDVASRAAINNVEHPSATPASENTRQQSFTPSTGFAQHTRFHVGIRCDHLLIAFILLPGNVSGMMVSNQYTPRCWRLKMPLAFSRSSVDHLRSRFCLPKHISPGIHRIPHHMPDRIVDRQFPDHVLSWALNNGRQTHFFSAEPK